MRVSVPLIALLVWGCGEAQHGPHRPPPATSVTDDSNTSIVMRSGVVDKYPCAECHKDLEDRPPTNPPREPHEDMKLSHMENVGSCYTCHDKKDRNMLVRHDGSPLDFDEAPKLCGQCHAEVYGDWKRGIHGKIVGSWNGKRQKFACPECHDPHNPSRPKVKALPPPPFPKLGIRKPSGHAPAAAGSGAPAKGGH